MIILVAAVVLVVGGAVAARADDTLEVNLNQGVYVYLTSDNSEKYVSLITGIGYAGDTDYTRVGEVIGSFKGAKGLITSQMSSGNANILHSDVEVNTDVEGGVSLEVSVTDNTLQVSGSVSGSLDGESADISVEEGTRIRVLEAETYIEENYDSQYTRRDSVSGGSFSDSSGVVTAQLSSGNANILTSNMEVATGGGDATSITVSGNTDLAILVSVRTLETDTSLTTGISVNGSGEGTSDYVRSDEIRGGSFDRANGLVTAQLSSGDANIIHSSTGIDVYTSSGTKAAVEENSDSQVEVVSDMDLRQVRASTSILSTMETGYQRLDVIEGSFNAAQGIIAVQTSSGAANILSSTVTIRYGVGELPSGGIDLGGMLPVGPGPGLSG